jgi:hypothetical protein
MQIHNTQEPNNTVHNEHVRFTFFPRNVPKQHTRMQRHTTLKQHCANRTYVTSYILKTIFLSVTVRLSAVVLFFGMKTHNASISTRRYRYRYPFYVALTWYGRFMQKLREEIECYKSKKSHGIALWMRIRFRARPSNKEIIQIITILTSRQ